MNDKREENLRKLVNSSGYLFQLRVEHEINETGGTHNWDMMVGEYPWADPETGKDGFIDLVLRKGFLRIVVECKRSRDASWVFLVPENSPKQVQRARCLWTRFTPSKQNQVWWPNFLVTPESPEAKFCVIRGKGEDEPGTLERLSGSLLTAIDCLASEELQMMARQQHQDLRIYLPCIVTTAQLFMCRFNPGEISIEDGTIPNGEFEAVPLIRFRKSLTTKPSLDASPRSLQEAYLDKERTVFVVHASELANVLRGLRTYDKDGVAL